MSYARLANETLTTSIDSHIPKFLFNTQQLVIFFNSLAATWRSRLKVTGTHCHREVGNKAIDCFATAVRDHGPPSCFTGHFYCSHSLGERTNLVELDEHCIGDVFGDATLNAANVCDEEVVSHQLNLVSQLFIEQFPAVPVVLR